MLLIHNVKMDITNCFSVPVLSFKQYDSGHIIRFAIFDKNTQLVLTHNNVRVYIRKPDNKVVYQELTVHEDFCELRLSNQTLSTVGISIAELEFQSIGTTDIVTSPIFKIRIEPTMIDDSAIESSDEFTALKQAMAKIDQASYDILRDRIDFLEETRPTVSEVQELFQPLADRVLILENMDIDGEKTQNTLKIYLRKGV